MVKGGAIRSMAVGAAAVMVLMLMKGTAAETLTVGDDSGWRIPPSPDFYSSWAAKHAIAVGDTLEFKFSTGLHTVAMVTSKDAYDNCDSTNAKLYKTGPADIPLTTEGEVYFFCAISSHCANGQKLAITVGPAGSKPIAPSTSQEQSPPAAHDRGSAPSPTTLSWASTFSLSFVALVMAFGY